MRTFIALELDDVIQNRLAKLQKSLRTQLALAHNPDLRGIKWTDPRQIHLTLNFLGEVEDQEIMDICRAIDAVTAECEPFDMEFGAMGTFPEGKSARIIWVGLAVPCPPLMALQKTLETQLAQLGFPPENRGYKAHLTLARINNTQLGFAARDLVNNLPKLESQLQPAEAVTVFHSQLTRQGPIYTAMHHSPFAPR